MSLFDKLKQLQEDNVRLTKENKNLKEKLEKYEIENKKLRNSLNMKDGVIVGLKHQVQKLEKELEKLKK